MTTIRSNSTAQGPSPTKADSTPVSKENPVPPQNVNAWATESSMAPAARHLVSQASGAVTKLVIDEVAKNHKFDADFSYGLFSGTLLVSEEVALRGSGVYRNLVSTDRRRQTFAEANPDTLWVKTRALVGASVNFPLGGLALGFNGSVEVSSIAAQPKSMTDAVEGQVKSMYLPLKADGFKTLGAAPGTEWVIRGQAGATIGNASVDADLGSLSTTVGVAASVSRQNIYTKNVKLLENNKVFLMVGKHDVNSVAGSLGVDLGLQVKDSENRLEQRTGDAIERKLALRATVSGSMAWPHRKLGGAVLDLENANDRMHYEYLMKAMPLDADAYIKANNLGSNYEGDGTVVTTGTKFQFGSVKLLSTSTVRATENGQLQKQGVTSQLGEASYNRVVEGVLPRMAMGEERNVMVRAGTLTTDGQTRAALSVRLAVSDRKVTANELAEQIRFANAMGVPTGDLPDPARAAKFGRGEMTVELAATHEQLRALGNIKPDDVRLAFATAQRDIEGAEALPVWFTQPEVLEQYRDTLAQTVFRDSTRQDENAVVSEYRNAYPGRDLRQDLATADAVKFALAQARSARDQPVEDWGKVLEAVGMQSSNDVRAGLLALHRLTGAELVQLSTRAGGARITASNGTAPKSLHDLVGSTMLPE